VAGYHSLHHLPNRTGLTLTALRVAAAIPVEARERIVGTTLLREKQRESMAIRKRHPA
jgi:hypothetical protein